LGEVWVGGLGTHEEKQIPPLRCGMTTKKGRGMTKKARNDKKGALQDDVLVAG
jgi:hypothetical protein